MLLSIYSHFSRSAKRVNELEQYYYFSEQDFKVKCLISYSYSYTDVI